MRVNFPFCCLLDIEVLGQGLDWRTRGALLNRLRVWDPKQGEVREGVHYSPPSRVEESKGWSCLDLQLHPSPRS